ncbi:MAG: SymE family type I addiction module toxin [Chitinophaga sp.]|uniref:SymE family type I addiction module toxin n=1 Tax=Chitinophaga sp. TaxID=1869181 RepID=UPI0025BF7AAD|nr:SymE family type I addiction module toxin [Chitinophaga sp.]MBV8252332.1 SymE family type I addiction module toxin [Chitinophaga sp.]
MQSKNRIVKIHGKWVQRTYEGKTVPWLNLSGVWLEKAGFEISDHIIISVENGVLTIKIHQKAPKPVPPFWVL